MTKNEKINKLANAVREWRGSKSKETEKWIIYPKAGAHKRVARWLVELGIMPRDAMPKIAGFESIDEFHEWIKTI